MRKRRDVTFAMLEAATRKAIEAGLFSRRCSFSEERVNREIMREIVQAALDATVDASTDGMLPYAAPSEQEATGKSN